MRTGALLLSVLLVSAATAAAGQQPRQRQTAPPEVSIVVSDVNRVAADGTTALHRAVRANDAAQVQALIRRGANVAAANRYGVTPIQLAAESGNAAVVQLLVKGGVNVNARLNEGQTVLMTAARTGSPDVVKVLLDNGADINARESWFGQTSLMWAAGENHPEVVKLLAQRGAALDLRSTLSVVEGLTNVPQGGQTAMAFAARNGNVAAVNALAGVGANLDLPDPDGITPLCMALLSGSYDAAKALIELGADVNKADRTGRGPLFVAVDMNSLEWRFNRPAPPRYDKGGTAAMDIVKLLLAKGATVDVRLTAGIIAPKRAATGNRNLTAGATPFLKAATTADLEMMKLLKEHGADVTATTAAGTNALMMAVGLNWNSVGMGRYINLEDEAIAAATWLMEQGLDINAANNTGETALHGAAQRVERDATRLIQFLVDRGASVTTRNKRGRTPLHEALGEDPGNANNNINLREAWNAQSASLLRKVMGLAENAYPENDESFKPVPQNAAPAAANN